MDNYDRLIWKIIDTYFKSDPRQLVKHHIDSYNLFFNSQINNIFRENNPLKIRYKKIEGTDDYEYECDMYLGGVGGDKVYIGKPTIYDNTQQKYMYPNEARLRNMNYGASINIDVDVNIRIKGAEPKNMTLPQIYLGKFPIMVQSDLCILNKLSKELRFNLGECKNDYGGYFIVDGKEKVIISQEKFADNMLYIRDLKNDDKYSHSAEIRSVSEDSSKPTRKMSIKIGAATYMINDGLIDNENINLDNLEEKKVKSKGENIVVNIPNVRKPVPLFILMRALGIISDKEIIKYCLLDLDKNESYMELFKQSIYEAKLIYTQETALKYIAELTKYKTIPSVLEILSDYYLPHIGELNFEDKAYYTGHMVFELLKVYIKVNSPTDRDNFSFKRVELTGKLIYELFYEYYKLQLKHIQLKIDNEYYYKVSTYKDDQFEKLIRNNYNEYFRERILESGFKKAFKGNWGAHEHTKRLGLIQDLNRLSYNSFISGLRKINLPLDASAKVIGPRLLHGSQWGFIDPVDTPDGGNVGTHKHLAISTSITTHYSLDKMKLWFIENCNLQLLCDVSPLYISNNIKVFINGLWTGVINEPIQTSRLFKLHRRLGLIPKFTSFSWIIKDNLINVYTDGGRLIRPIFYVEKDDENKSVCSFNNEKMEILSNKEIKFNFDDFIIGFNKKEEYNSNNVYIKPEELYKQDINTLNNNKGFIEYIDSSEEESALITTDVNNIKNNKYITHVEIHPSFLLGVMGNQVVFPENNQLPRDLFACGQGKQGVSLYHSNYQNRIDKMGVVLNYGEIPLIKSRYMKYINNEEHPYGENVIVAIMCHTSYNVEDSILFNKGSVDRGMFRTTYFNSYEDFEESSSVKGKNINSRFSDIKEENVLDLKPGYDYSDLNSDGIIKENTKLNDKKVIIGKTYDNLENLGTFIDSSTFPKKGQLGFVDKTYISNNEEGFKIAKVRIREERIPAIGDKFCSRCGQKGTIGLVIPECDMPFSSSGIKPDIIINPHAIPSRMTIGQLIETLLGKLCLEQGQFGDCTAFVNKGSKVDIISELLNKYNYHSEGLDILYNGNTGEQIESNIFIGPTYYMRLKHMVKDKINYRAKGPREALTRQTLGGRANDGGLRIGEMERDCIISHGATSFLQDSMLKRGDNYYMAVCNNSGMLAIYNKSNNIFLSPDVDGPIKFTGSLNDDTKLNIKNVSRFGRSFSIVQVPYCFKLLIQELQIMNVQIRIITEDNIDKIEQLAFSKEITDIDNLNPISLQETPQILEEEEREGDEGDEGFEQKEESDDEEETDEEDEEKPEVIDVEEKEPVEIGVPFEEKEPVGEREVEPEEKEPAGMGEVEPVDDEESYEYLDDEEDSDEEPLPPITITNENVEIDVEDLENV